MNNKYQNSLNNWVLVFFVVSLVLGISLQPQFAKAQIATSSSILATTTTASNATSSVSSSTIFIASSSLTNKVISTSTVQKDKATSTHMSSGKASWYSYRGGLFAASPDFPAGSILRVTSVADPKKQVDVMINDWGPDRSKHPDRVIDLDKIAFAKLAPLGAGVISVRVEPLKVATSVNRVNILSWSASTATQAKIKTVSQTNNDLKLTSAAGIVVDAKTGKVIWQKNANEKLPLASLTKMVAAKVFLDTKPKLSKVVTYKTIDEKKTYQWANPGEVAKLKVKEGETMTVQDALYAALLGSANNSVETLVRVSGLTRVQFMSRMNKYVKQIGANNTSFVEPTGLAPQNVSSVKDYAIISRKVLANPTIAKVTSAKSYSFSTRNTKKPHNIKNTNKLLTWTNLKITGSKTGYLYESQYCLMTRAKSKSGEVIAVTFGTPDRTASFNETKKLLEYGFNKL